MFAGSLLIVALLAYGAGVRRLWRHAGVGRGVSYPQTIAYALGWLAVVVALMSPLDDLADQLFSAHMVQHELLMVVAAPLVALAAPMVVTLWALPAGGRRAVMQALRGRRAARAFALITAPATVWLLHAVTLWIWHMPLLFDAALRHEAIHSVQHLSFFWTAALFWWGMAHGRYGRIGYGAAVVYVFATAVHSGVLGALLTFSPRVWYPLYAASTSATAAFGLTPLEDQQLAGLLMWVPAGVIFIAGGLFFFTAWLRESERRVRVDYPEAGSSISSTPL
jgi:putative membrane protein